MEVAKRMRINCEAEHYDIDIVKQEPELLRETLLPWQDKQIAVIWDEQVHELYAKDLAPVFKDFRVHTESFTPGEASKSLATYERLTRYLLEKNFTRGDLLVAIGGGVATDLVGFVAATFLRGIPFIAVPTTLLAMVDASVGGKTGLNFGHFKNQIGSFYFPQHVHIESKFIQTLEPRQLHSGLAEVIKYAFLSDANLYQMLQAKDQLAFETVIERSVKIKLDYVQEDPKDLGKRQCLNLGHTVGHAIEALSDYTLLHGEAVALGLVHMCRASERQGLAVPGLTAELIALLKAYDLPTTHEYAAADLLAAIQHDKKKSGQNMHIIIPKTWGEVERKLVSPKELAAFLELGQEHA